MELSVSQIVALVLAWFGAVYVSFGLGKGYAAARARRSISQFSNHDVGGAAAAVDSAMRVEPVTKKKTENGWIVVCEEDDDEHQCLRRKAREGLVVEEEEDDDDDDDDDEGEESQVKDDDDDMDGIRAEHLRVIVRNANDDVSFFSADESLLNTLTHLLQEADLPLVSYHCHSNNNDNIVQQQQRNPPPPTSTTTTKVSFCVALLPHGHATLYSLPQFQIRMLDIFHEEPPSQTFLQNSLIPTIQETFLQVSSIVPNNNNNNNNKDNTHQQHDSLTTTPTMQWTITRRGFQKLCDLDRIILDNDLAQYKVKIASTQTPFQHIDIYDAISSRDTYKKNTVWSYRRSLLVSNSSSSSLYYEARHPQYYLPDRFVFLDGVLQSTRFGDAGYHEPLVHPAMMAVHSPPPKRVAIIGGGEGATLREVLKHRTVEEVVMIEIDEDMVNVSREYLPEWCDCSDFVMTGEEQEKKEESSSSSWRWCGDDPRVRMYYEDALAWFMDRYGGGGGRDNEPRFDVIIMDALDPESEVPFAKALYRNDAFLKALYRSLSEQGVIAMQLGEELDWDDPPDAMGQFRNRAAIRQLLGQVGFESLLVYDEKHSGFGGAWSYTVALKSYDSRSAWYSNEAQFQLAIHKRLVRTKSGNVPLSFMDGPTMTWYQIPLRGWDYVHCRQEPTPPGCHLTGGFVPERPNAPASVALEARQDGLLFAKTDIPKDSYVSLETAVHPIHFPPQTLETIQATTPSAVQSYIDAYGRKNKHVYGDKRYGVMADSGCLAFLANNGRETAEVCTAGGGDMDPRNAQCLVAEEGRAFNPVLDRRAFSIMRAIVRTSEPIPAGGNVSAELVRSY